MTEESPEDLFDLVHESIFVRALDGRILSWNSASAELYGWSADRALGQSAHHLLDTRHAVPIAELETALLARGRWDGELRRRTADGAERVIEARWSLRHVSTGAPVEIIEVGRDITERRAAEAALAASERRYSSLFQAMAASFWELDFNPVGEMLKSLRRSGVSDLSAYFRANPGFVRDMMRATRVVDVNEETVKLFGGGDDQAFDGSVEPFWPVASGNVFAASVIAAVSGQRNYAAETRFRRRDGSEFDGLFTACFPDEGVARGVLLVGVIDITERNRAQAALQTLRDDFAHSARVALLGELTASIAHEVNQPLAAIATNGAAGLRWLRRDEPDVEQALKLAERIVLDAQRAGDIIARIRSMAVNRPAAPDDLSINRVIEESIRFLQHELQASGVRASLNLADDLPVIRADRTQMQQVLVNLAVNAIQSMVQAGTEQPELWITSDADADGGVAVSVADNGPGVDAQALERLFDSFYTTKASGMGMGLPICRSILESLGGGIGVANSGGGGAIFTLRLPAGRPVANG